MVTLLVSLPKLQAWPCHAQDYPSIYCYLRLWVPLLIICLPWLVPGRHHGAFISLFLCIFAVPDWWPRQCCKRSEHGTFVFAAQDRHAVRCTRWAEHDCPWRTDASNVTSIASLNTPMPTKWACAPDCMRTCCAKVLCGQGLASATTHGESP